jgi:cyclopropane fatty-acyl-phospholipid synthase-like methyltransferase
MQRFIGNQFRKPNGFCGRLISRIMIKGNSSAYDKVIPALEIQQGDKVLEIGYGHGLGIHIIASRHDCLVTGIDFSELMFREASKRNKKHIADKKVELAFGDLLTAEIGSEKFDKVFCVNVVYFWDNLDIPFAKIFHSLKAGGLFCIYMVTPEVLGKLSFTKEGIFNRYSVEEVMVRLEQAGFIDIVRLYGKGSVIRARK